MKNYETIAVDFDGTLCFGRWPEVGEPNTELISFLKRWNNKGNKLILWTCRTGQALETAVKWCEQQGLFFDAINDNLQEYVELYGNNSRKICCDYYIDDKSIRPNYINKEVPYDQNEYESPVEIYCSWQEHIDDFIKEITSE